MLSIDIKNISYKKAIVLENININILQPGLYGLFGKNGGGKTTFLKSICDLVSYNGNILFNNKKILSHEVAWIPTEPDLYEYLTIEEFYKFYSLTIQGYIPKNKKMFSLEEHKIIRECSTGTKKKAYINAVLQYDEYSLYIFDEPFNGLDIEANYTLLNEIINLSKNNIVFISSHIIEFIESYLTEKFIISNKSIIKIDADSNLKEYFSHV